jgi:hypothetical protein
MTLFSRDQAIAESSLKTIQGVNQTVAFLAFWRPEVSAEHSDQWKLKRSSFKMPDLCPDESQYRYRKF